MGIPTFSVSTLLEEQDVPRLQNLHLESQCLARGAEAVLRRYPVCYEAEPAGLLSGVSGLAVECLP